jgi:spore germination protein YaaH
MKTLTIIAFAIITMAGASTVHAQTATSSISTSPFGERIFYMSNLHLTDGTQSLQANASSIDILAPQLYVVDANLNATGSIPAQIMTIAQTNNIKVMPLISNQNFKQNIIHDVLVSPAAQDQIIDYLIRTAIANGYIGWQFDFENIYYTDRDLYSLFVEKAAVALHNKNLILSVAAVPRVNDDASTTDYKNWSGVFDYGRLANAADFLSIMTYSDPNSTGPTASLPYVQSVLDYLKGKVPANKMSLGIPLYYWGWNSTTQKKVRLDGSYSRLQYVKSAYKTTEGFDTAYQVPYLIYSIGKSSYIIWHEDARSVRAKLNLIRTNGLRGFSAWVLGLEDPSVWQAINSSATTTDDSLTTKSFSLLGVKDSITFGQALDIAKNVAQTVSIRPAFLLGILQEEFSLENSDMCYLTNFQTGNGIRVTDGTALAKVVNPQRDIPDFLILTKMLGKDPSKTPITCPMSFGWGGAMGPADFIPSTWFLYKDKIEKITGKPADPWNIQDAFLAAGLFLSDAGAAYKNSTGEWNAAMIYFSGSANSKYIFYAQGVIDKTNAIQSEIMTMPTL